MFIYRTIRQNLSAPGIGPYVSFGILALQAVSGREQKISFTADVSVDRSLVDALAARCTAGQLDPRQLSDVIEDALAF